MQRRLLITTSTLPRSEDDPQPRFVLDLAGNLSRYFDVTVLAPGHPAALSKEILKGVRTIRYRYFPLRSMERLAYSGGLLPRLKANPQQWIFVPFMFTGLTLAVRRLLRHEHFDCVHCHWLIPQGLIQAAFFSGIQSPPFVVTSHGADVHAINNRFVWRLYLNIIRKASAYTVVSETVAGKAHRMLPDADIDHKLSVIPMGVDPNHFHPNHRDPAWSPADSPGRPFILFVGSLVEKKGVQYLLEAFMGKYLKSLPGTLLIVGDGPLYLPLRQYARRIGVSSRVRFLGALAHNKLNKVYASCDVFCAPSIVARDGDAEGFPTVLLEAAASGLPVITTGTETTRQFIWQDVNGFLVPEKDSAALEEPLAKLLESESIRRRMGRAARDSIRRFTWDNVGERYYEVIDLAIARHVESRKSLKRPVS